MLLRGLLVVAVAVAGAAVWRQQISTRERQPGQRLQVDEWVPPAPAARPADAGIFTSEKLLPHLRVDESGAGARVKEEFTPLLLRRPLMPPPMPSGGDSGGASYGVVILANGRDADLRTKAYALISTIRRELKDPTPVAIFYLGHAESFSPAAVGVFTALGNVSISDLGALTGLPSAQKWAGAPGFLSKPRAAVAGLSRWQSVLMLDADALIFQPPAAFFALASFRQTGLALWRDYQPCFTSLSPFLLRKMQLNSTAFCAATRRQESDSSAVVIGGLAGHTVVDSRCAAAGAAALCEHGAGGQRGSGVLHAQQLMLGDKDSWALGAALCGMGVESSVAASPPGALAIASRGANLAAEKATVAVYTGQLQFDDHGQPLYWNGQSVRELTRALAAAGSKDQELRYMATLPSLKPKRATEEEARTTVKVSGRKLRSPQPVVEQVLMAAAEAAAKLSSMDGIGHSGTDSVAPEDVVQVVSTMLQHGRRLHHAKRAGSALLELDRAATLACGGVRDGSVTVAADVGVPATAAHELVVLCAMATNALAGSLSAQGNSGAAGRAYRKVLGLIGRAAPDSELPKKSEVLIALAECLADSARENGLNEALNLVATALELEPSSISARLNHGALTLRHALTDGKTTAEQLVAQEAALDDIDTAIALSEEDNVPCATGHFSRGNLLEHWVGVGDRTAEAHACYIAVLELTPNDEEALAAYRRTAPEAVSSEDDTTATATAAAEVAAAAAEAAAGSLCTAGEEQIPSLTHPRGVTCVGCPAGKFDHDSDSASGCKLCRPGYDSPTRSTVCMKFNSRCEQGHMESVDKKTAAAAKKMQGKGLFRNHLGLSLGVDKLQCHPCPVGTFDHDRSAATACVRCKPGMYSLPGSTVCVDVRVTALQDKARASRPIDMVALRQKAAKAAADR